MSEHLEINSFDDLKAALDKALHESGVPSETADYLMEQFDVLCVDIDNVFLSISANDIQAMTSITLRGIKSRLR